MESCPRVTPLQGKGSARPVACLQNSHSADTHQRGGNELSGNSAMPCSIPPRHSRAETRVLIPNSQDGNSKCPPQMNAHEEGQPRPLALSRGEAPTPATAQMSLDVLSEGRQPRRPHAVGLLSQQASRAGGSRRREGRAAGTGARQRGQWCRWVRSSLPLWVIEMLSSSDRGDGHESVNVPKSH